MQNYLSFYPKGFETVVEDVLQRVCRDLKIKYNKAGRVLFETNIRWESISRLSHFDASFLLINYSSKPETKDLAHLFSWAESNKTFFKFIQDYAKGKLSLRVVDSSPNYPKSHFRKVKLRVEDKLRRLYGIKIDLAHPDSEIRFIEREDFGFVGIRVSKPPQYKRRNYRDRLRPDIASLLIELSEPRKSDVFLDPFSGSGIIPSLRTKLGPFHKVYATDRYILKTEFMVEKGEKSYVKIIQSDYKHLDKHFDKSISKIVTDPPWGAIETNLDIEAFYRKLFTQFIRICAKRALVVLITSQVEIMKNILDYNKESFYLENCIDTEVSGREASVFKIRKVK
ncbi:MAG: hypothetical protein PHS44_04355 [Candidatus Dojkabacteria bacterium]|nr:hypothetical protein [Candidatus Dojkabacteria bacterium]